MTDYLLIIVAAVDAIWIGLEIRRRARSRFEAQIRQRDWSIQRDWLR